MNPLSRLSEDNQEQVRRYLRFFRQKKDGISRGLTNEFNELKNDALKNDDVFSRDDMEEYADNMRAAIKNFVESELNTVINMSSLAVSQLLANAQDSGVELSLETASVENQVLLEAIEKMTLDSIPKQARRGVGQLTSFKDEAKMVKDASDRMDQTNRELQAQLNDYRIRLAEAEATIRELRGHHKAESNDKLRSLEHALEEAKEEGTKRVAETSQFQQMKKLMQSQSNKIRELRRRLQQYEPDTGKEEDD